MRRLAIAGLALVALASGCMGEGEKTIEAAALPNLVLQPDDLGERFVRFDEGRLARADFQPGPREAADRFGRVDGWKARYRLAEAGTPPGPLVVVSMIDLFAKGEGAERDLDAYRAEFESTRTFGSSSGELEVATIGDETFATSLTQSGVLYYKIAWRSANATASVLLQGFEMTVAEAVALANKQQRRILQALEQ
jgi:hypothetical protein